MGAEILVGTDDGLHAFGGDAPAELSGRQVVHLAAAGDELWAVVAPDLVLRRAPSGGGWSEVARVPERDATCVLPIDDGALVGTFEAHLYAIRGGTPERVEAFETVEGREQWFTPWGGPPSTRSLAAGADGTIHANVHVGGIPRSTDGGGSWHPTVDIRSDVHEVRVHPERGDLVLAAAAVGLGTSEDGGTTWRFVTEGLAGTYARAVAAAGDVVFLTASDGPGGSHAAVYRAPLGGETPLERCRGGLPEWFDRNINTHCLDAGEGVVAFGTDGGSVYASSDDGSTWELVAGELPSVNCLLVR
jgi:hypothetical protein